MLCLYSKIIIALFFLFLFLCWTKIGKALLKFTILVIVFGIFVYFVKTTNTEIGDPWSKVYLSQDGKTTIDEYEKEKAGYLPYRDDTPEDMFYWNGQYYDRTPIYAMNSPDVDCFYISEKIFDPDSLLYVPIIIAAPFVIIYEIIMWIIRGVLQDLTGYKSR